MAGDHLSDLHPILGGGNKHKKFDLGSLKDVPEKFDWREKNVIGPILDQQRVRLIKTDNLYLSNVQ